MENKEFEIIDEIVMNEYTMHEILLGIWTNRMRRSKIPVLYLAAVLILLVFGLTTGKGGYTLLAAVLLLAGMAALFVYLGGIGIQEYKETGEACPGDAREIRKGSAAARLHRGKYYLQF